MHSSGTTIKGIKQTNAFLFFWTGQFMYIGTAADTSIHAHHAIQIAISFSNDFEIIIPGSSFKCRAVIIDSDQAHECRTFDNTFLLLNIAPESKFGVSLKKKYLANRSIAELPVEETAEFTRKLKIKLAEEKNSDAIFSITRQFLYTLSDFEEINVFDERILEVLRIINEQSDVPVRIKDLAGKVFISPGRLIHLFTDQVGIPIRKYILWTKLLTALERIVVSKNITDAALYAGFSDAPHFNRVFKRMFGLNPTRLLKNSQIIQLYAK